MVFEARNNRPGLGVAGGLVLAAMLGASADGTAADGTAQATPPQQLVDRADVTLRAFLRDPDMAWLRTNLPRARGVLIAPEVLKAGFVIGGTGGRAVLVVRDAFGSAWRGPAFYTFAMGSVGFQAGIGSSETVALVMTDKGINALLAPSLKLGAEASIAAGPVGAGAGRTPASDLVSFARSKGVFGGLDLDGTVITANNEWNTAYYGRAVLAADVLVPGGAVKADSSSLLATVSGSGS